MSTISIVGAGNVARGIATRAIAAGDDVQIVVRDQAKGEALAADLGGNVTVSSIGAPLAGDLVFLAIPYLVASDVVPALETLPARPWSTRPTRSTRSSPASPRSLAPRALRQLLPSHPRRMS